MNPKTVAEINLSNLTHNIRAIERKVSPSGVIPVVKANAYGHGSIRVAKHLAQEGFKAFAVAQFQEAMELRDSGITQPILIFGRLFPEQRGIQKDCSESRCKNFDRNRERINHCSVC